MSPGPVAIGPPEDRDYPAWRKLYQGYADFYQVPMTDEIAGSVWAWFSDSAHPMEALIARDESGHPIGLAHFRGMPRPLRGAEIGFLDDLFVDPSRRGEKIGEQLFDALVAIARQRGWAQIRWLTKEDNYRARTLYDRVAGRTMFLTYELSVDDH